MPIYKLEIVGLRGFATKQTLNFAVPNGNEGSGLTVIVGPNNSGKSTITEAINAFSNSNPPSFTEGKRNILNKKHIEIVLEDEKHNSLLLKTISTGGSETEFVPHGLNPGSISPYIVPSRRTFSPYFGKNRFERNQAIVNYPLPAQRGQEYHRFAPRLFQIQQNPERFNQELERMLGFKPTWTIEQSDSSSYYLKFTYNESEHNSDGAGEGLLSIFTIVDALYDSKAGDIIIIDEPELSLHPALQRNLIKLLVEYAKDRQVIISTHSPYFIDWESIANGGHVVRVIKEDNSSKVYALSSSSIDKIRKSLNGINNPHVFGLTANEVFFLNENVILVEGQEDVVIYKKVLRQLGISLKGEFYGWGVGGAENMQNIAALLVDLGFKKVVGILDGDKSDTSKALKDRFPQYSFFNIDTDDVRDKPEVDKRPAKEGLTTSDGKLKEKYKDYSESLFTNINELFK